MNLLAWENYPLTRNGLRVTTLSSGSWCYILLAARDTTGKHYFEADVFGGASNWYTNSGYFLPTTGIAGNYWCRMDYRGGCYAYPSGGSVSCPGYADNATVRLMCAYDLDAGKIWFGNDGVWVNGGDPANGVNPQYTNLANYRGGFPGIGLSGSGSSAEFIEPENYLYLPAGFSPPTELPMVGSTPQWVRWDVVNSGLLSIVEPVTRLNTIPPQSRRVRLCDQRNGRLVREQWSDPVTGLVTFEQLREGPWVLYALDHTHEHEAVAISDRLATADGSRP